ncbi:MAG: hypothetical protein Q4C98_02830 [Capnocytophaga sp.]|nr:hypothetical protein [Capnocytophaga sp.]
MNTSYFRQAFSIVFLAALFFIGLKEFLPKRIFPDASLPTTNVVVDSLMLEAISGTSTSKTTDSIAQTEIYLDTIITAENHKYLNLFFEKLEKLESLGEGKIRIGYFGDSMTDGDFIVQDLRQLFQDVFGGLGVGFVPITSESAATRASIRHSYSQNWKTQSFVNVKKPKYPFGVSGRVSSVKDSTGTAWVEYKASSQKHISELYNPTLFYGASGNPKATVEILLNNDTTKITKPLNSNKTLNALKLSDDNVKRVRLRFTNIDSIPIYGINSDNNKGIHIDNFSSRGNSGLPLSLLNAPLMQKFEKNLGIYDLIVLHFGANVLNYGSLNYSWYVKGMTKVVQQLKACFPKASILIISTADKATKYETEMKTDLAVIPLANAQKKYAEETQSGFINLFQLMGGEGSMVKWVESEPILATKDYTHFNARGSKKIARLIYDELMKEYELFKQSYKKSSKNVQNETHTEETNNEITHTEIQKDSTQTKLSKDSSKVKSEQNFVPKQEKEEKSEKME